MRFALTADWHLRGDRPRCRQDLDWIESQRKMVRFIVNSAKSRECRLMIVGDIFHTPRVSHEVLNMTLFELQKNTYGVWFIAGNHDLPYHNYDLLEQSSVGVLAKFFPEMSSSTIEMGPWNASPFGLDNPDSPESLVFSHQLVFPNAEARPMGCKDLGRTPEEVLEQFPHADIVCVGDYHHKFVYTAPDGRMVINPGCTIRQVADMKDYKPSFYIVDTEARTIEEILIPDDYELVSDEYLVVTKEKSLSMSAFVEAVKNKGSVELDFKAKLGAKLEACEDAPVKTFTVALMQETFNESK